MFQFPKDVGELNLKHFRVNPLDHIGLVVEIANEFLYRGFEFDDLAFYGIVGLLKACKRYDRTRGVQFSTYGSRWIRDEIRTAFKNDLLLIRVPVYMYGRNTKIERGEIDPDDMVAATKECVEAAWKVWQITFYGIAKKGSEECESFCNEASIPDYRDDQDLWRQEEDREYLLKEMMKLEAEEHRIMILLYYQGMTVKRVCKKTGLSKDVVRKTRDRALRKLRESMRAVGV